MAACILGSPLPMSSRFTKKIAGLLVPAFALREEGDLGIGDAISMRAAIDFCAARKLRVLQILPINETGGDNSPYNAISSVALDPVLLRLAPGEVPGLLVEHLRALADSDVREELGGPAVDYPRVKKLKLSLLRLAYAHFDTSGTEQEQKEFARFEAANEAWLDSYTLFRTLLDRHHGDARWPLWGAEVGTPTAAEAWLAAAPDRGDLESHRAFHSFVQWVAYRQWTATKAYATSRNVDLMGDIPFGISRYSADVWAQQELFDLDWSGGAPPEHYFQGDKFTARWGQNWGIPLYHWGVHKARDYTWWKQRVAMTCRVFHTFRIDHVLGFFRVYSFPWTPERNLEFTDLPEEEVKRSSGGRLPRFVPRADEPAEDAAMNAAERRVLLEMIEEAASGSPVVAEDLGVVPKYVRPLLKELDIPGFTIPHFERIEDGDPADYRSFKPKESYPPLNLITYATHDHDPLAVLYERMVREWTGPNGDEGWREIQRLMSFLQWKAEDAPRTFTEKLHLRFVEAIVDSPCWLAVLMVTDLLGTKQRFNEPGMVGAGNWSQRLDRPLQAYLDDPAYAGSILGITALVEKYGRV